MKRPIHVAPRDHSHHATAVLAHITGQHISPDITTATSHIQISITHRGCRQCITLGCTKGDRDTGHGVTLATRTGRISWYLGDTITMVRHTGVKSYLGRSQEDAAGHKSQAGGTRSLATPNAQRTTHTSRQRTPGAVNQRVERQAHHERSSKQIASKSPAHTRTRQ